MNLQRPNSNECLETENRSTKRGAAVGPVHALHRRLQGRLRGLKASFRGREAALSRAVRTIPPAATRSTRWTTRT